MKKDKGRLRKAIFAVVYSKTPNKVKYVILKRKKHWKGWEFPKGKIERFETKRMAAKRESKEETGLKILKIKKFRIKGIYKYKRNLKDRPKIIGQTYTLFALEGKYSKKIIVDKKEHYLGKWVSFKEAYKNLTWPNQRKCIKIVNDWLKN